jgi:predicted AAA+ superfamily ATPase
MNSELITFKRLLRMDLPKGKSAFLWGPRKTGKSTWLKSTFPHSLRYDFLETDTLLRLSKQPHLLREELLASDHDRLRYPVILDEVQKIPGLLDEVHWLIENRGLQFILCGSSARKLKRGHANLLGGRAWRFEMLPLSSREIPDFDLLKALNSGLLPTHYRESAWRRSLKSYVQDYLKEEIMAEGLLRNMPAFARFLDSLGYSHGELTNYSNIARDCGVDSKTVRGYYQILIDTLVGSFVEPFGKSGRRQLITSTPKFYMFDVGVAGYLSGRVIESEKGELFGKAFEHFILMELMAYRTYREKEFEIRFWRTNTGLEVDFVLGRGQVAIEVKGSSRVDSNEMHGIAAFAADHKPRHAIVVCNEKNPRQRESISILPWRGFLDRLWGGKII